MILNIFWFYIVCLKDSVLAFHEHGMQGKSFKKTQVTQEILDGQRTYKLIGADRWEWYNFLGLKKMDCSLYGYFTQNAYAK